MATTRLMPLHTGKGRTVGQGIRNIIDYTENPQKTDGGRLITSWQCDSRIADAEFLFTKNQYIQKMCIRDRGIILESVLEGYAEYYSADLSEKVVRGMTDNALKCKFNGGMMPIGYVIDAEQHFQIDPLTAPFVLEAFKRYDGGETISSIMNWLNEQGLTNTRGRKMTFNSVCLLYTSRCV